MHVRTALATPGNDLGNRLGPCAATSISTKIGTAIGATIAVLPLLCLALAMGCSDAPPGGGVGSGANGGVNADGLTFGGQDGIGGVGNGGKSDGAGGEGASGDGATSDGGVINRGNGCEFGLAPLVGEPGAPCQKNDDCDAGICVDGLDGRICTRTCATCCPSGFGCEQWEKSDTQFICMPKLGALCRPCIEDAQCEAVNVGALCLPYGSDGGAFCGGACDDSADCPVGYACETATGSKGTAKQCVRKQGQCTCSPAATAAGAATQCLLKTQEGSCSGTRTCGATGLGVCNAPLAVAESCNGQDDDCDGVTDEGVGGGDACKISNAFGVCSGLTVCATGGVICDGVEPAADECNGKDDNCDGKTDEGYLDIDQDGIADCVDDDTDGDKVANANDCAPLDASVYPGAVEVCNDKDDNCDGQTDESGAKGCTVYYADVDNDGFGDGAKSACICGPDGTYKVAQSGDCNDLIAAIAPGGVELCDNGDNDCDGQTDEGFSKGQGCENGVGTCKQFGSMVCAADGKSVVCSVGGGAGGAEACNGSDDDCNGQTDEGFDVGKPCVSGSGACAKSGNKVCAPGGGGVVCDAVAGQGSGEKCDGIDNDCNGQTDEGCDDDMDGYCDKNMPFVNSLACPKGQGDCDDGYSGAHPGAAEVCNGKDDDCDGSADQFSESCANGCGDGTRTCNAGSWGACSAPVPQCTSGACCDGCKFKSSATKCDNSPAKTTYACGSSCGGSVTKTDSFAYCTGSSAVCGTSNLKPSSSVVKSCGANEQCNVSGASYSCKACSGGCSGSTCSSQPQYTICIDPQFGGNSSGACYFNTCTKTLNLDIAQRLQTFLNNDTNNTSGGGNWKVVMTRTGDTDPSISARIATCNNAGAHRVLSIAVNAYTVASANGIESYYNKASSKGYCDLVHNEIVARTGLYDRGVKVTGSYSIIKNVSTPYACFPAPGFLSNSSDAAKLKDGNFRNEIARGMLHGIQKSFSYGAFNP